MRIRRPTLNHLAAIAIAISALLFAGSAFAQSRDMVGDISIAENTVVVGDQTYRVQAGSRIYDERDGLIRLSDLNRIAAETYSDDNMVLMGTVESRKSSDGKLDLIELRVDPEEFD